MALPGSCQAIYYPAPFFRETRPFSVRRYFCNLLPGFSGRVYAINSFLINTRMIWSAGQRFLPGPGLWKVQIYPLVLYQGDVKCALTATLAVTLAVTLVLWCVQHLFSGK